MALVFKKGTSFKTRQLIVKLRQRKAGDLQKNLGKLTRDERLNIGLKYLQPLNPIPAQLGVGRDAAPGNSGGVSSSGGTFRSTSGLFSFFHSD